MVRLRPPRRGAIPWAVSPLCLAWLLFTPADGAATTIRRRAHHNGQPTNEKEARPLYRECQRPLTLAQNPKAQEIEDRIHE
jgi:hypothetical protein